MPPWESPTGTNSAPNSSVSDSSPSDLSGYSPQTRFSDRGRDYACYRPSYPQAALDWILSGMHAPGKLRIADLGAGTGISSRLLAQRGAQVVAVEPNPHMVASAARHTRVRYVSAAAEDTGLPGHSFDLVTAFQAFHWFACEPAMTEIRRLLKPSGRVAVIWNNRERDDAFMSAYGELMVSFGAQAAIIDRSTTVAPVKATFESFGFVRVAEREFVHYHRLDQAGLLGRARSASYLPQAGPEYARLVAGLDALFRDFADGAGFVTFAYRALVFRGDAGPAGSAA